MLHPSTKRLIDKLSEMTRKQRVTWTEGESASVVHDTEGYRVVITSEPHTVLLTDALGREIESCRPEEFADETDTHGRPYAKFVAELYREASRHARGTEKAIRTLLAGLDSVEPDAAAAPAAAAPGVVLIDAPDATTDETTAIESETAITAAVATLADQINAAPPEAAAAEVVPAAPEPAPQPEPEPVIAALPPEPEPVAEPEPVFEAAAEAPAPSVEVLPLTQEPGSFGTFGAFTQTATEPEPVSAPEPVPQAAAPEPEPVAAPEPQPQPVEEIQAVEAAPEPAPEPQPEPASGHAQTVPTLAQPISLSSIPFGFGLGAAQRAGTPSHPSTSAPDPAPQAAEEAPKRIVIDGTLDLPDITPDEMDTLSASEAYPPATPRTDPLDLPTDSPAPAHEPANPRRFNPWN